jgi:hypothetical protein
MPDLMQHFLDYVSATKNRHEASGFNPNMARVYGVMLEIARAAKDEADYRRLADERRMNLETYRCTALDTWEARARYARDEGFLDELATYEEIVNGVRAAEDETRIASIIYSGTDRVGTVMRERGDREHHMRALLDSLMEYAHTPPMLDLSRSVADARKAMDKVREAKGDPDAIFRDAKWREPFRLSSALWEKLQAAYDEINSGRAPAKEDAQARLKEEYDREAKELAPQGAKMRAWGEACDADKERKRSAWIASATPEGYDFEKIWMIGEDR